VIIDAPGVELGLGGDPVEQRAEVGDGVLALGVRRRGATY
jgi:hypothetical protein